MRDAQIIKVLISFGADINACSSNGETPFNMLSGHRHSRVTGLFFNMVARKPQPSRNDSASLMESLPSPRKIRKLDSLLAIGCDDVKERSTVSAMVKEVTKMLVSAGAKETPVVENPNLTFARSIRRSRATRAREKRSQELPEIRYKYYYLLREIVMKRLSNTADQQMCLSAEYSAFLLNHMREVRLLQMAGCSILCLDGGGMRGLMQVEILCQVIYRKIAARVSQGDIDLNFYTLLL